MLKKIFIFIGIILLFSQVQAETFELTAPVKNWNSAYIWLVAYTTGGQESCYWKYYDSLCGSWGFTFARVDGKNGIENINFLSIDKFVRFKGGPFWQRLGFGLGFFDRRTETIQQGWDFHLSWQLGYMFTKSFGIHTDLNHFSNGASFAKVLGIENFWPQDKNGETINGGGDTLGLGITVEFKF